MKKLILFFLSAIFFATAMSQDSVTVTDYQRAQKFLGYTTYSMVPNLFLDATWTGDGTFWYAEKLKDGEKYYLVNAKSKKKSALFNQAKLAEKFSKMMNKEVRPDNLQLNGLHLNTDDKTLYLSAGDKFWKYNITKNDLTEDSTAAKYFRSNRLRNESISPDGQKSAFIKNYNLWVRDLSTGKETQLTTDGVKDYGYATDNAGWKHSDAAVLLWSPDSKKIATFRQDQRKVGDMYLVTTNVGHPVLHSWKYPLPGDSNVIMIERVIINVEQPKVIDLNIPADFHRATLGDDIMEGSVLADAQWKDDGSEFAFVSSSRDHKNAKFRIANAATGEVKDVFEETVSTQFESGQKSISWRYLPSSNEVIWYSERDNWGHLYLYDSKNGQLKNQITKGDYVVSEILKIDKKNRRIYFLAAGLDKKNPYFQHFYSIDYDGKNFKDLTPEEGNHVISLEEDQQYFVDRISQPDIAPTYNLRNLNGGFVMKIADANVDELKAMGWKPCTPFKVKAADGVTDIYGLMFTPTTLDKNKTYPLVDYIYPGPQGGSVGSWSFVPSRGDHQSLAELGFVVVLIEGTGNPMRSKSFHDASYGQMAINTLPDQVAGIRQLAAKYAFIDTTRIGIWGHSGGGFATADAMFSYPDFFKVGISESGNHDNRNYEDDWGERYIGLLHKIPNGSDNYEIQANQVHAKNLKGKLLLAHGLMDDNVPPYNTFLVVEALQKANKDFDLIVFPSSRHGYGSFSMYMMRKRWDYFIENLMGAKHPKEFKLTP